MWDWSALVGGLTPGAVMEQINLVLANPVVWSLLLLSIGVHNGARIVRSLQRLLSAPTQSEADAEGYFGDYDEDLAFQRVRNEGTAFASASRADQDAYYDYQVNQGGTLGFNDWRDTVAYYQGAYNIHDSLSGLKQMHRGEYAKAKRREKQNNQAGRTWGRAEARARRRANKSGRKFNKTAWENRRLQGEGLPF